MPISAASTHPHWPKSKVIHATTYAHRHLHSLNNDKSPSTYLQTHLFYTLKKTAVHFGFCSWKLFWIVTPPFSYIVPPGTTFILLPLLAPVLLFHDASFGSDSYLREILAYSLHQRWPEFLHQHPSERIKIPSSWKPHFVLRLVSLKRLTNTRYALCAFHIGSLSGRPPEFEKFMSIFSFFFFPWQRLHIHIQCRRDGSWYSWKMLFHLAWYATALIPSILNMEASGCRVWLWG